MKATVQYIVAAFIFGAPFFGCADWDNPMALSELQPEVEFELDPAPVETFQDVKIQVHVAAGGAPLGVRQGVLKIERVEDGPILTVETELEGDGYAAHLMFFEPGEYHLHFIGIPEEHRLEWEMGEHEIEVKRMHRIIGPYWVELELRPAPVLEGTEAHIHLLIFEISPAGTPGERVRGLGMGLEVHDPAGNETGLAVEEEGPGEYEAEYAFGEAGLYELHVELQLGDEHEDGEFHVPVLSTEADGGEDHDDQDDGGNGHGHGH